ncbi:MAG: hypothetical protein Q8P64_11955, partial [Deltaproteobacteria bacterium]|nr:hypothetical protein [Deltaproteobacteria bacterium]
PLFSKSGNWCILEAKKVRCDADCFALDCECVLTRGYKLKVAICHLKLHVQWVRNCERTPIFGNLFKAVRKPAKMKKGSR